MEETIKLKKKSDLYKMFIPQYVEEKIRHMCNRLPSTEWSGILFYDVEGSMENKDLNIICRDFYVMDIGNATYTEFDMTPEVVSYMCDNNLLDCHQSLIHNHHSMSTTPSGTDLNTLLEEGKTTNHFVSLIVNNAGTYTAMITRKVKAIRTINETVSYGTFNDNSVSSNDSYTEEEDCIEYFYLDITKECVSKSFDALDRRLDEIKENKKRIEESRVIVKDDTPWYKKDTVYGRENNVKPFQMRSLFEEEEQEYNRFFGIEDIKSDDDVVDEITRQYITGSIVAPDSIDLNKWCQSMPEIYGKRFGSDPRGMSDFAIWAEQHYEYLLTSYEPDTIYNANEESTWWSDVTSKVYAKLDMMPENDYVLALKQAIETWMIM